MVATFRIAAAALGWFALVLQFAILTSPEFAPYSPAHVLRFFSFFTILTNTLVALAFTFPAIAPQSAAGRFFARPSVRAAIACYIVVVFAIYHWLLAGLWQPQGWQWVADNLLHTVMPALFVIDWLVFVPKGTLSLRHIPRWLLYPLVYVAFVLVQGALNGFYPYPFIDAAKLGLPMALLNAAGVAAIFALLGLIVVAIDRALARNSGPHPPSM